MGSSNDFCLVFIYNSEPEKSPQGQPVSLAGQGVILISPAPPSVRRRARLCLICVARWRPALRLRSCYARYWSPNGRAYMIYSSAILHCFHHPQQVGGVVKALHPRRSSGRGASTCTACSWTVGQHFIVGLRPSSH